MACRGKPTWSGIGDGDDLHDAGVEQPLHALADGGLGQPDRLADGGVRPAAVLLQLLDDGLGDVVERDMRAPVRCGHGPAMAVRPRALASRWQANPWLEVGDSRKRVPWHQTRPVDYGLSRCPCSRRALELRSGQQPPTARSVECLQGDRRERQRRALRNFVDGEYGRPATDGRSATSSTRRPARSSPPRRSPSAEDVDRAYAAAAEAFETWRDTPRASGRRRCSTSPTRSRRTPTSSSRWRARTPASRIALTRSEEIPPMVDQIRFFAGAARVLEGRAAGRVHGRPHLVHPARADRRRRPGHAVELPDDDGGLEVRAGASPPATPSCSSRATPRPRRPLLLAEIAARVPAAGRPQRHLR